MKISPAMRSALEVFARPFGSRYGSPGYPPIATTQALARRELVTLSAGRRHAKATALGRSVLKEAKDS